MSTDVLINQCWFYLLIHLQQVHASMSAAFCTYLSEVTGTLRVDCNLAFPQRHIC